MAIKIIYSANASRDIKEIFDFIKEGSLKYARIEVAGIREYIEKLKSNIYLGKPFAEAETNTDRIREVIFKNYRIIYEIVSDKRIDILTIHHHARSLSNNPAFKDEE